MKTDPRQYGLDFSSPMAEALATLRRLPPHLPHLPVDLAAGVADLLERIALCSRDRTTSHARASKLAAGLDSRRAVSERTVRRWRAAAENTTTAAGPLLVIDHRSQRHGGHRTNEWTINWPAVRLLLAGAPATPATSAPPPTAPGDHSAEPPRPDLPEPGPGPKARHLAALALTMTEAEAETALAGLAHRSAGDRTPAGRRPAAGRTPAGHDDRPKAGHHDRPTVSREKQNPPTDQPGEGGGPLKDWQQTVATLEAAGLATADELARLASLRGHTPASFEAEALDALATAKANAGRLRSPAGAAAWKLRTGAWPDGLTLAAPAELAAKARRQAEAHNHNQLERLTFDLLALARKRYHAGHDPATIRRDIETAGHPPEALAMLTATAFWTDFLQPETVGAPTP